MPEDETTEYEATVTMSRTESFTIEDYDDQDEAAEFAEFVVRSDFHKIRESGFAYEVDIEEVEQE